MIPKSITTTLGESNAVKALEHMKDLVGQHPLLTLGLATGAALAMIGSKEGFERHAYYQQQMRAAQNAPSDATTTTPQTVDALRRSVGVSTPVYQSGVHGGSMEGYISSNPAYIQPDGAGYENPTLRANHPGGVVLTPGPLSHAPMMMRPTSVRDNRSPRSAVMTDQDLVNAYF